MKEAERKGGVEREGVHRKVTRQAVFVVPLHRLCCYLVVCAAMQQKKKKRMKRCGVECHMHRSSKQPRVIVQEGTGRKAQGCSATLCL